MDLLYQSTVERYIHPDQDLSVLPPLHIFQDLEDLETPQPKGVVKLSTGNDTALQTSKVVFEKATGMFVRKQFTRQQLEKRLEEIRAEATGYHHYPWEWILFVIPLFALCAFLTAGLLRYNQMMHTLRQQLALVRSYVIRGEDDSTIYEDPDGQHVHVMSMPNVNIYEEDQTIPIPRARAVAIPPITLTGTRIPRVRQRDQI